MEVTYEQIRLMKHAIGFGRKKVSCGKYIAWRNYFCSYEEQAEWESLVDLNLAGKDVQEKAIYYFVNDAGLEFLGKVLEVKIRREREN